MYKMRIFVLTPLGFFTFGLGSVEVDVLEEIIKEVMRSQVSHDLFIGNGADVEPLSRFVAAIGQPDGKSKLFAFLQIVFAAIARWM